MVLRLSSGALDRVATGLSQFKDPAIPELALRDDKTLQYNMLAGIIGLFSGEGNAPFRHVMTNIVRRVFASIETYRLARAHALEYVAGDRHHAITPYFLALTHFESCIGYSWQTADLLAKLGNQNVFDKGDGSAWQRLHDIHVYGSKHTYAANRSGDAATLPTSIWLTNEGITCLTGAQISYQELAEIVAANNELFYEAQAKAQKA